MTIPPVAIVTGAGSGIGRETAMLLADAGYNVALVGTSERKLEQTIEQMEETIDWGEKPAATYLIPADLADAEQARSVVDITRDQWGRVDVLINCAGVAERTDIEALDETHLYNTFAINVFGPALLTACAWPTFRKQKGGCVVNVSSKVTIDPVPGLSAYAASKAALECFTRSIHNEGAAIGVRSFGIAPGPVETPMLRRLFSEQQVPPARANEPLDVANVICACVRGERDADIGRVIQIPTP